MEKSPDRNFQALSKGELRDIGMGEFGLAYDDKPLLTMGASTCIVIAAYNTQTGYKMLGHFSDLVGTSSHSNGGVFEVAVGALQDLGAPEKTQIELHGGGPFIVHDQDTVEADRAFAVQAISNSYPEIKLSEIWLPENKCIDVSVEQNGNILTFTYPK